MGIPLFYWGIVEIRKIQSQQSGGLLLAAFLYAKETFIYF